MRTDGVGTAHVSGVGNGCSAPGPGWGTPMGSECGVTSGSRAKQAPNPQNLAASAAAYNLNPRNPIPTSETLTWAKIPKAVSGFGIQVFGFVCFGSTPLQGLRL